MEKLNPSVKALTVMILGVLICFRFVIPLNLALFLLPLLLVLFCSKASKKRLLMILVPALVAAYGMFMMGYCFSSGGSLVGTGASGVYAMKSNLETALDLSTRLLAFAGLGIFFSLTTVPEDFAASLMDNVHLSPKVTYSVLAAFHLEPKLEREYRDVQTAFRVRGLSVHPLSLKVIFTMLVNAIRYSESLSMAMEVKGFTGNRDRSAYRTIRIRWYDWLFCISSVSVALFCLFLC